MVVNFLNKQLGRGALQHGKLECYAPEDNFHPYFRQVMMLHSLEVTFSL